VVFVKVPYYGTGTLGQRYRRSDRKRFILVVIHKKNFLVYAEFMGKKEGRFKGNNGPNSVNLITKKKGEG